MVGLFTYLAVIRRAPVVFTLTSASMIWESIAKPNLAGREHLIAVGAAIVMGLLHGRRRRVRPAWVGLLTGGRSRSRRRSDTRSPTPDTGAGAAHRRTAHRRTAHRRTVHRRAGC